MNFENSGSGRGVRENAVRFNQSTGRFGYSGNLQISKTYSL